MYTAIVQSSFSATHQVRMPNGEREAIHGHEWVVRACFCRAELDDLDMVVDFCAAQDALAAVVAPLAHRNLNELPALARHNPTAEAVARHIFEALVARGFDALHRVEVTEAPGCVAAFEASRLPAP